MNKPIPVFPAPAHTDSVHLVVLTGMSGSGKTIALRALEDLKFYCVDNLPLELLPQLLDVNMHSPIKRRRIAVGVDARSDSEDLKRMPRMLSDLTAKKVQVHLVFINCNDEVLIKRYSETRRRHPMAQHDVSLTQAIKEERKLLEPLMAMAEQVIDSSELNVHQLRRLIAIGYSQNTRGLTLMFQSFAFKRGLPLDSDFMFDARCLPNPHWKLALRPLSGRDIPVQHFLETQPMVNQYLADTTHYLQSWLPRFEQDHRSHITIALGCTGGKHRSVYLVEKLAAHFRTSCNGVLTFHRELE